MNAKTKKLHFSKTYEGTRFATLKSLFFALTITGLNYMIKRDIDTHDFYNTNGNTKIIDFIAKITIIYYTLDCYNLSLLFKLHHCIGIAGSAIVLYSNHKYVELLIILINFEITSIFHNLYFLTKNNIILMIFVYLFYYIRIYKFYEFIFFKLEPHLLTLMCEKHDILEIDTCSMLFNSKIYTLLIMNTYWGYLLGKKIILKICYKN
jgi:hypothetical protein